MSTTVRAIVREWQRRHHLRIKPDVLGELIQKLNAEHGSAEAQPKKPPMKGTCPWCGLAGHNYVGPPCPGPPGGWPRTEMAQAESLPRLVYAPVMYRTAEGDDDLYARGWNNALDAVYHGIAVSSPRRPTATAPSEMHGWEVRDNVRCVVCPGCLFTFSAEHTTGDQPRFDCPNCTIECLARDTRCPDCGKMMTNHVVVTRHEDGPCDETFTGPPLRSYLGDDET